MNFIIVMSRMHCKVNGSKFVTVYLIDDWKCLENVSRCQIGNESDIKIVININTLFFSYVSATAVVLGTHTGCTFKDI